MDLGGWSSWAQADPVLRSKATATTVHTITRIAISPIAIRFFIACISLSSWASSDRGQGACVADTSSALEAVSAASTLPPTT
jgi:hypothetical protein